MSHMYPDEYIEKIKIEPIWNFPKSWGGPPNQGKLILSLEFKVSIVSSQSNQKKITPITLCSQLETDFRTNPNSEFIKNWL